MIFTVFDNVHRKTNVEMVFVGIPNRKSFVYVLFPLFYTNTDSFFLGHDTMLPAEMYNMVKHCANQKYGLMNQCFSAEKMMVLPGGYFSNFLLKVNGKMGGENSVLDPQSLAKLPFNPSATMLVGVEMAKPSSDGEGVRSSVVAAVASSNNTFTRFNATVRVQSRSNDEAVKELHLVISDLLGQYHTANNSFPKNMIIFRSGVSDGQFDPVLEAEVPQIKRAFTDVTSGGSIKIVYIAVQKRHQTRFALAQQDTSARKPTFNVPSGTVVDKGIVNPSRRCFFLNSHFSPLVITCLLIFAILYSLTFLFFLSRAPLDPPSTPFSETISS